MSATTDIIMGANAERSRSHNRRMVLGQVRMAGRIGRAEIARASGLSIQAVSNITSNLLEDGLIVENRYMEIFRNPIRGIASEKGIKYLSSKIKKQKNEK